MKRESIDLIMPDNPFQPSLFHQDLNKEVFDQAAKKGQAFDTAAAIYTDPETTPRNRLKALTYLTFWREGEWNSGRIQRIIDEIDAA